MSTNFWELLQQHQGDLTKSGRTVAEYLVQHAAEAQYLSISSLARECQVAEATVFRFCRALGFEGYHEMRIALAQANATGVLVNQQEPAPDADTATLCEHASALFMTAINGTQNALSPQAVEQAVALLHTAFRSNSFMGTMTTGAHNVLLEYWLNVGLFGLASYFIALLASFRQMRKLERQNYIFCAAYMLWFMVMGWTERSMSTYEYQMVFLFLAMGVGSNKPRPVSRRRARLEKEAT